MHYVYPHVQWMYAPGNPSLTLGALVRATAVREWFPAKAQCYVVEDMAAVAAIRALIVRSKLAEGTQ